MPASEFLRTQLTPAAALLAGSLLVPGSAAGQEREPTRTAVSLAFLHAPALKAAVPWSTSPPFLCARQGGGWLLGPSPVPLSPPFGLGRSS